MTKNFSAATEAPKDELLQPSRLSKDGVDVASERNCEAVLVIAADTHVGMTENGSHNYNSDERKLAVT